ncbi:MAG: hypothetical protein J2P33_23955, partial [Actinobacteria bacterium]|nr:hypothetical protein [Actinomycetota bacterium]
ARLAAELGVEPGPELQQLHQRVLAGDPGGPAARAPGPAARPGAAPDGRSRAGKPRVVPRQLPAAAADFAGRAPELAALTRLAAPSPGSQAPGSQGPGAAAPVVISGTAGVGKTTLALHWASRAAGDFPDGQLYLDLRGYGPDPGPVPPGQALRGLLAALGVPPARITGPPDRQAALYRSLLAGRRMLVVLDNARDERQVRPLLPGGAACRVLITSRSQLTGLLAAEGARLLSLDVMSEADARQLLARKLGQERARAEPAAAGDLALLCAHLPLALAVAAALAAARPGLRLSALAAELRDGQRLDCLETGDAASSVREVLSWSVRALTGPTARMFRLLGVHPGPDISAAAAASLAGVPLPQARRALAELVRGQLLTEPAPGRFGCHDLLRAYAAELASADPDEGRAALRRVLGCYLRTATAAAWLLYPARDPLPLGESEPGVAAERLAGRAEAFGWLTAEYQVLLAAVPRAAAAGLDGYAWQLPAATAEFLNRQGHWHELAAACQTALAAAARLGDLAGQAHAEQGLGTARLNLGCPGQARAHLRRAARLFRQAGE